MCIPGPINSPWLGFPPLPYFILVMSRREKEAAPKGQEHKTKKGERVEAEPQNDA